MRYSTSVDSAVLSAHPAALIRRNVSVDAVTALQKKLSFGSLPQPHFSRVQRGCQRRQVKLLSFYESLFSHLPPTTSPKGLPRPPSPLRMICCPASSGVLFPSTRVAVLFYIYSFETLRSPSHPSALSLFSHLVPDSTSGGTSRPRLAKDSSAALLLAVDALLTRRLATSSINRFSLKSSVSHSPSSSSFNPSSSPSPTSPPSRPF